MAIWKLAVLFFCALGGGLGIFVVKSDKSTTLKLILSFSGAFLFGVTVLHLIPDAYAHGGNDVGLFILLGFFFQIILEQFSQGIEHGHIHHSHHHEHSVFPYGIMISLCLHAFLEGMPLARDHQNELIFGIALHHIPASFALASVLRQNKVPKNTLIAMLLLFAVMAPLGYYISTGLSTGSIGNIEAYFSRIMGVVIGIFLHISTTILFESSVDHRFNRKKMIAVVLGASIAVASYLFTSNGHFH